MMLIPMVRSIVIRFQKRWRPLVAIFTCGIALLLTGCRSFLAAHVLEISKVKMKPVEGLAVSNHYQEDFLYLKAAGEEYFPFEDRYFPRAQRAGMEREIVLQLGQPACIWETFVLCVRRYLAAFNSEHACIQFNPQPLDFTNRYPFKIHYVSNDLYLSDIAAPHDRSVIGQKIKAINGVPISEVEEKLFGLIGEENICVRRASLEPFGYSRPEMYRIVGLPPSSDNQLKLDFADHSSLLIAPGPKANLQWQGAAERRNPLTARQPHPYDCRIFPEQNFAYLQFNTCFDRTAILDGMQMVDPWFRPLVRAWLAFEFHRKHPSAVLAGIYDPGRPVLKDYMESAIHDINRRGITNLIIDLRYNGGGEIELCRQVLYFLTTRTNLVPPAEFDAKELHDFRAAHVKKFGVEPTPEQLLQARHQEPSFFDSITNRSSLYYVPPERSVYEGRIMVLVNHGTASAASHLASMTQDNRLATLVGTSTGNNPTGPTMMLPIKLPHSGILISLPGEYLQRAVPSNGEVLQPDCWAENSIADNQAGRDAGLEKALELFHIGGDVSFERLAGAEEYMKAMKKEDRLPGWSKNEKGGIVVENYADSITFRCWKSGDSSTFYHYEIARASKDSPWKLQRAWRTDRTGHMIKKLPAHEPFSAVSPVAFRDSASQGK